MPEASLDTVRAQQALSILEALERLPAGQEITVRKLPEGSWRAWTRGQPSYHRGESATDALGQLTTVMSLEGDL